MPSQRERRMGEIAIRFTRRVGEGNAGSGLALSRALACTHARARARIRVRARRACKTHLVRGGRLGLRLWGRRGALAAAAVGEVPREQEEDAHRDDRQVLPVREGGPRPALRTARRRHRVSKKLLLPLPLSSVLLLFFSSSSRIPEDPPPDISNQHFHREAKAKKKGQRRK